MFGHTPGLAPGRLLDYGLEHFPKILSTHSIVLVEHEKMLPPCFFSLDDMMMCVAPCLVLHLSDKLHMSVTRWCFPNTSQISNFIQFAL